MRLNLPYANRQNAKHKDTMQADSSALSLWLLAAANSWLRVPPFTQALFDMVIIKQPCLLHYSHIGMPRQPQEVEKEEWTLWWEERLGRDERLRAVSQFGRLAPRQQIPFPCQSALSLFWIRLDLHRLMIPEAWDHQRLSAQNQILASWDMCGCTRKQSHWFKMWIFTHRLKPKTPGIESLLVYCKEVIQRIEMRPDRL